MASDSDVVLGLEWGGMQKSVLGEAYGDEMNEGGATAKTATLAWQVTL